MTIPPQAQSERDWVSDISALGDRRETALGELRHQLISGLSRAFRQLGPQSSLVEDSVQEALLLVTERIHSFRGDSRFISWALAIATRVALTELRRARWREVSLEEMAEAGKIPPADTDSQSAHASYAHAQLINAVDAAIQNNLTEKQRAVIYAELGGAPTDEIARRLGTNRNALYKLVYDARVRLKQALLTAGWTERHVREVLSARSHDA